jgi:hypothetical protein
MKTQMRQAVVFDGRNQYDPGHMREAGFEYYGIGREKIDLYSAEVAGSRLPISLSISTDIASTAKHASPSWAAELDQEA